MCELCKWHDMKSSRKTRSQFRFQWLMHGIKCVRTNPSMIPNMLRAFERGPIDLRAMSFAQNRLISGDGSEEQMRVFPNFFKRNLSLFISRKETPNKSKKSFRAHIVSFGWLGMVGKSTMCLETLGFAKNIEPPPENSIEKLFTRSPPSPPAVR